MPAGLRPLGGFLKSPCRGGRPARKDTLAGLGASQGCLGAAPVCAAIAALSTPSHSIAVPVTSVGFGGPKTVELEDELTWVRHRVMRLRAALRFVQDPQ